MSFDHPLQLTSLALARARCVMAGVRLGLFEALREGPVSVEILARDLGLRLSGLERVIDVLVHTGIVVQSLAGVGLNADAAALVLDGEAESVTELLRFEYDLWELFSGLEERLQGPEHPDLHDSRDNPGFWRRYLAALDTAAAGTPAELADLLASRSNKAPRQILDIGGGGGAYALAFVRRFPLARLRLIDLAPAAEVAQRRLQAEDRIDVQAADVHTAELGADWERILALNLVPHFDAEQRRALFRRACAALKMGGDLVLMSPSPALDSNELAVAGHLLFWLMCGRRLATADILRDELLEAGFSWVERLTLKSAPGTIVFQAGRSARLPDDAEPDP